MHTHSQPNLNLTHCTQNLLPQNYFGFIQIKIERVKMCKEGNSHPVESSEIGADKLRGGKKKRRKAKGLQK